MQIAMVSSVMLHTLATNASRMECSQTVAICYGYADLISITIRAARVHVVLGQDMAAELPGTSDRVGVTPACSLHTFITTHGDQTSLEQTDRNAAGAQR
jgi:hypothetical protein